MQVTVVYSPGPRSTREWQLDLPAGATVAQALVASGMEAAVEVGVWGRKANPQQPLREQDRVEIYRPLLVDPKVARRERFRSQGVRAAGLFAKKNAGTKAGG